MLHQKDHFHSFSPWSLWRWRTKSTDDLSGGSGMQGPSLLSLLGHWPPFLRHPSPMSWPVSAAGHLFWSTGVILPRSLSVYTHQNTAAVLQRAGVAPEHPSFGTLGQTPSTCSEAKCEQSLWKFCTRSVIRSKRFDNEQTASISKQRHEIL